jgi:hypothetical protein
VHRKPGPARLTRREAIPRVATSLRCSTKRWPPCLLPFHFPNLNGESDQPTMIK